jgi:hypothetical protein
MATIATLLRPHTASIEYLCGEQTLVPLALLETHSLLFTSSLLGVGTRRTWGDSSMDDEMQLIGTFDTTTI